MPPQDSDGGSSSSQAECTSWGCLATGTLGFGPLREGLPSPSSGALEGLLAALAGGQTLHLRHCRCQHSVERLDTLGLQRAGVCRRARRLGHPREAGEAELAGLRQWRIGLALEDQPRCIHSCSLSRGAASCHSQPAHQGTAPRPASSRTPTRPSRRPWLPAPKCLQVHPGPRRNPIVFACCPWPSCLEPADTHGRPVTLCPSPLFRAGHLPYPSLSNGGVQLRAKPRPGAGVSSGPPGVGVRGTDGRHQSCFPEVISS